MSSAAQIIANRLNSQKSTGPRSPEGKTVVAKNAIKHGLFAREAVITGENIEDFELLHDAMLAEMDPAGVMEAMLAERIVSLGWRLQRVERIQNQVFDVMVERDGPGPLEKRLKSALPKYLREVQDDHRGSGPGLVLGRAAIKDLSGSRVLERLLMYERRIENSMLKTIEELRRRKIMQELEEAASADEQTRYETSEPAVTGEVATQHHKNPASHSFAEVKNAKQSQFSTAKNSASSLLTENYGKNSHPEPARKQSQSEPICRPGHGSSIANGLSVRSPQDNDLTKIV